MSPSSLERDLEVTGKKKSSSRQHLVLLESTWEPGVPVSIPTLSSSKDRRQEWWVWSFHPVGGQARGRRALSELWANAVTVSKA